MLKPPIPVILAINVFLSGAAFAATAPYRAVVGVETLGLSNAAFALVMVLTAIGGALAAVALGWLSDLVGDRRWLVLICAAVGAVGFGVVWLVQTPIAYVSAFCLLVPFGNALFSQGFAYSRAFFDRTEPQKSELKLSLLRSLFTLAWVVMPPAAGWLAAQTSAFSVFALAAFLHVGSTLLVGLLFAWPEARIGAPKRSDNSTENAAPRVRIAPSYRVGIVGVTLARICVQINMTVLPLVILRDLDGSLADIGINAAFAAAVEVPFMIGWGYAAMRLSKETILAINCVIMALYMGLMTLAQSVFQVLLLQAVAAIAIAALLSVTITYLQGAIKGRIGLSTSILDVTQVLSVMGASAIFALNPGQSFAPLMAVGALLGLLAAGMILWARELSRREPVSA